MSWKPVDLLALADAPTPPPEWCDLVYADARHVFSGEPESLKTLAAMIVMLDVIDGGGHVIWIDFEMGAAAWKARMRELGATDETFLQVSLVEPDDAPAPADLEALIRDNTQLTVIDAASGAYDAADLDDFKPKDAERWARIYLRTFRRAMITTLVIDHVVKDRQSRGKYASGSHRKVGGVEAHLGFDVVRPLSRGGTGLVHVYTRKDRYGHLARPRAADLELRSDPTTHAITWTWKQPVGKAAPSEQGWRPTRLMEKVSRYIELAPANRSAIYATVTGKRDYLIVSVDFLLADGHAEEIVPGQKGTKIRSLKPYREESSPSSPVVPDGSPNGPGPTVPTVPAPTGATGDGDDREQGEVERLDALYGGEAA